MNAGTDIRDQSVAPAVPRLRCDCGIDLFPGFHPELVTEGPPEQVEIILFPHAEFKILQNPINGHALIMCMHYPALLHVHRNPVHDSKHAQVQARRIHHLIAVHTDFKLAQLSGGRHDFDSVDQIRECGVIPAGAVTTSGDQPAKSNTF